MKLLCERFVMVSTQDVQIAQVKCRVSLQCWYCRPKHKDTEKSSMKYPSPIHPPPRKKEQRISGPLGYVSLCYSVLTKKDAHSRTPCPHGNCSKFCFGKMDSVRYFIYARSLHKSFSILHFWHFDFHGLQNPH